MWSPVGLPVVSQGPRLEPRSHSSVRNPWRIITRRGRFAESGHQSSRPLSTQELSLKETGTRLADGAGAARAEMSPDNGRRPKWQSAGAVECTRIGASSCTVLAKTLRRVLHLLWYRAKAGGVPSGVPCTGFQVLIGTRVATERIAVATRESCLTKHQAQPVSSPAAGTCRRLGWLV